MGNMIGVGIFGLPFAFAQVGFRLGIIELLIVGGLSLVGFLLYADLVSIRGKHARFITVISSELGPFGAVVSTLTFLCGMWGAMIAYLIVGGGFAHAVFGGDGDIHTVRIIFYLLASVAMFGGVMFVQRVQSVLFPVLLVLVGLLFVIAFPSMSMANLTPVHWENATLPLGVILFAFGGLSAVPEVRDLLGRHKSLLAPSTILGMCCVAFVYIIFVLGVLALSGVHTSQDAISGISTVSGDGVVMLGSLIGMGVVFSACMAIGLALTNTFVYDFRLRHFRAWSLAVGVPLFAYLAGAKEFIDVIGWTGGVLGGLNGVMLVLAYERARVSGELPKNTLRFPQWVVGLTFGLYVTMILVTLFA